MKESKLIETLQRRATKFILSDYSLDYKSRLISLKILPLTLWLELQDVILLIKLIQHPPDTFSLHDYIVFVSSNTRSTTAHKIRSKSWSIPRTNTLKHSYFNRIINLWNKLPPIDTEVHLYHLKKYLEDIYWDYFIESYSPNISCSWYISCPCTSCSSTSHSNIGGSS